MFLTLVVWPAVARTTVPRINLFPQSFGQPLWEQLFRGSICSPKRLASRWVNIIPFHFFFWGIPGANLILFTAFLHFVFPFGHFGCYLLSLRFAFLHFVFSFWAFRYTFYTHLPIIANPRNLAPGTFPLWPQTSANPRNLAPGTFTLWPHAELAVGAWIN